VTTDPLAQAAMVAYCGWDPTVAVTNEVVTLDGNGTEVLGLPSLHVTAVTSVVVTDGWGTVHTYLSTDSPASIGPGYTTVAWSENGVLTCKDPCLGGVWPEDEGNVAVTYSGGYGTVPAELAAVLASLSARMPQLQSGRTSARLGSAGFAYAASVAAGGLLLVEQMVLDRYRIPRAR
jgi:hypothetical protein